MSNSAIIEDLYSIQRHRDRTEQLLTSCVISFPSQIDKVDQSLIRSAGCKKILGVIEMSKKKSLPLTRDFIFEQCQVHFSSSDKSIVAELFKEKHDQTEESLKGYSDVLRELNFRERTANVGKKLTNLAISGAELSSVFTLTGELAESASSLYSTQTYTTTGDAAERTLVNLSKARAEGKPLGVPYHLQCLRKTLGLMYAPDLVVVAARPSVGKTALALNIGEYANAENPMGIISSEMDETQLVNRLVISKTGLSNTIIRDPSQMDDEQFGLYKSGIAQVKGTNLYIDDRTAMNDAMIEESVEEWVKLYGVKVVFVDYIQRIESSVEKGSVASNIGYVAKRLKEIARKHKVCVIALAQINRDSTKEGRRPEISDIKGSGDIEQEADTIMLLHKPTMGTIEANGVCVVEGLIKKNRHGPICNVLMNYYGDRLLYKDMSREEAEKYLALEAA